MKILILLFCPYLVAATVYRSASLRSRKPSRDPNWDGKSIQSAEEYEKNYTTDENPKPKQNPEGAKIQSEEQSAKNVTSGDLGPDNHDGGPGKGHGRMVPRTSNVHKKDDGKHGHWTYAEPHLWADGFEKCGGQAQSPIDIETSLARKADEGKAQHLIDLVDYVPLPGRKIVNHGHNVQVNGEFGDFHLPDGSYEVKQFHFHFPSEHQVDGVNAAGEIHIVHQKAGSKGTDDLAVIGILLEVAGSTAQEEQLDFLSNLKFGSVLPAEGEEKAVTETVDLNAFSKVLSGDFYHYEGSLTTPPCSETVHWYVLKDPAIVTSEMVNSFKVLYPSPANNRPVAPLNGRAIVLSSVAVDSDEFSRSRRSSVAIGLVISLLAAGLVTPM